MSNEKTESVYKQLLKDLDRVTQKLKEHITKNKKPNSASDKK